MKILALNGSPRGYQSSTRRLLAAACNGASEAGAETKILDICELEIQYCNACGTCYRTGSCILDDDFGMVYGSLLSSDGVIFSSPVYINSVTAQLKTFIDRLADAVHCQRLAGRYGCSISTAGGSHAEEVATYLNSVINTLGGVATGSLGVNIMGDPKAVDSALSMAEALGFDLCEAIGEKRSYPDQEADLLVLRQRMIDLVLANKDEWRSEYEYWESKGVFS